jgi:uncharacterized protein
MNMLFIHQIVGNSMSKSKPKSKSNSSVYSLRAFLTLSALLILPIAGCVAVPQKATAQISPGMAYQMPEQTLSVTGQGMESIPTTLSEVRLGVLIEAKTAEEAQQKAAEQSTAVVEWVRSQKVEKLQTTGISLSPRYEYTNDRQVLVGYQATNSISFRTPTENAGAIMDEAVRVGATQIDGVSFVADDEAIEAARQRALERAVQDAQAQADSVLGALGFSSKKVVNISIGALSEPPPMPYPASAAQLTASSESAKTPVIGQEQEITAQVTLQIRY